jgi:hypothetical protein
MDDVETSYFKGGFEILHAVANRVRLRAVDAKAKAELNTIAQQLRQQDGVCSVSANEQTGSLLVTFEPNKLPLLQLEEALQPFAISEARSLPETSWLETFSQVFTGVQSLIPPLVGLMTTRSLGMYGWRAMATYLVTTGLTREAIANLNLELPVRSQDTPTTETQKDEPSIKSSSVAYSIIHQIPGRIRFHIPCLAWDRNYVRELERLAAADKRMISLRVNPDRASAILSYRADLLSDSSALIDLIQAAARPNPSKSDRQPADLIKPQIVTEESPDLMIAQEEEQAIAPLITATSSDPLEETTDEPSEAIEPSTLEKTSPWSHFKSCMLALMLKFMANLPVKPANV